MGKNAIFIAATGQNVGKTTLCLGIIAALKKRFSSVGFIKPVGQQHLAIDQKTMADKDAVLFKHYFKLQADWGDMSPVIVPTGFTRDFIDEKISVDCLLDKIWKAFTKVSTTNDYTIVEGTGHVGVGSIIDLNNARVAKALGLEIVIIASGGLGSCLDELALNFALCEKFGVPVRGVILNRVLEEKKEMIEHYVPRALNKWGIPLIGTVPYNAFLSKPTVKDFEALFNTSLISGGKHHFRHFDDCRLVAGSLESYKEETTRNTLVITPATREDIILATIDKYHRLKREQHAGYEGGMILTGRQPPSKALLLEIKKVDIPTLYAPLCSYDAMKKITSHIAKIQTKDTAKIEQAIKLVEENIDMQLLTKSLVLSPSQRSLREIAK